MSLLLANAQESAESARLLLGRGSYDGTCDRAFFAMFNAARAMLETRGMNGTGIKSHAKVRALLTKHFVETGRLTPEMAFALGHAEKLWKLANFATESVQEPVAREMVKSMDTFMSCANAVVANAKKA